MTNATKAQIIALANAVLALVVAFGLELTDAQLVGVEGVVNGALSLWVAITYKSSPKRVPEGPDARPGVG